MGIFDRFPYSSTHEMNLDFMLGKATEIAESLQEIDTHKEQAEQAATNAAQSAQSAAQAAQAAAGSQTAAGTSASQAAQHKADAEDAADRAEAASNLADEAVEHAQTAAQNASTAADGAIASATAAENRINALAESLPEDFTEVTTEINKLKSAAFLNVKDYGAKGDGVTQDADYIQAAIDAAITQGKAVYIPAGTYLVNKTLTIYGTGNINGKGSRIVGDGIANTIIKNTVRTNKVTTLGNRYYTPVLIDSYDETAAEHAQHNFSIENLTIDTDGFCDYGLVFGVPCANFNVSNINIENTREGGLIASRNTYLGTFKNIRVNNFGTNGILIYGGTNTALTITNCYVLNGAKGYIISGSYSTINNCEGELISNIVFDIHAFTGVMIGCGSEASAAACALTIDRSQIEISGFYSLGINASTGTEISATYSYVTLIASYFGVSYMAGKYCNLANGTKMVAINNRVENFTVQNTVSSDSVLTVI